jgi:hypothetical protein
MISAATPYLLLAFPSARLLGLSKDGLEWERLCPVCRIAASSLKRNCTP